MAFRSVLVANRGEIARRILRTLRAQGLIGIAVHSDADASAPHVREADAAVRIGPASPSASYLDVDAVMGAVRSSGAEAVHPGYGFLSESVALAKACAAADVVFIGPSVEALEIMGDKARARAQVAARGVPVVPGFDAAGLTDAQIALRAAEIGYPLLVKPRAGGGGKGMEAVTDASALDAALSSARRVAASAFGDDALLLERLIRRPRHIEVQVFGDVHGTIIPLGERECTLQRRHQKVIEEAPAVGIDPDLRERLLSAAVQAAQSVSYVGAGTVEFLVDADAPGEFSFIEMNTRLQVEHPVTEAITGLDLVALQLSVAAGERLPHPPPITGHAIEARVYAESPERGFLPSVGRVLRFDEPHGVRVDAAIETGSEVTAHYDPMIAKVIAHSHDRAAALAALDTGLADTVVLGVETNIGFLRQLLADERVVAGDFDTGLIETMLPVEWTPPTDAVFSSAAGAVRRAVSGGNSPWRHAGPVWQSLSTGEPSLSFLTDSGAIVAAKDSPAGALPASADADGAVWVVEDGRSFRLRPLDRRARMEHRLAGAPRAVAAAGPEARAPMAGTVVAVHVADGERVEAGQRIVSIEAMKMEHPVLAPHDGLVRIMVAVGDHARREEIVATVAAASGDEGGEA